MKRKLGIFFYFLIILPVLVHAEPRYSIPTENSPFIGSEKAPVTIIEFIDYQ